MGLGKIKTDAILSKINNEHLTDEIENLKFIKDNVLLLEYLKGDITDWISANISEKNIGDGRLNAYSATLNQESFGSLCRILMSRRKITDYTFNSACADKEIFDDYCSMLQSIYDKTKDEKLIDGYKIDDVGIVINHKTKNDIREFSGINNISIWFGDLATIHHLITDMTDVNKIIKSVIVKETDLVSTVKLSNDDFKLLSKKTNYLSENLDLIHKLGFPIFECNLLLNNAKTIISRYEKQISDKGR